MTSVATVLYVMIASPSDVSEARQTVFTALSSWNESNSRTRNVVLVARRWETTATPLLGDHPQAIINKQLVDESDIFVALFGSRVGAETPNAISGTVEEIERAVAAGKPVHLFFSTAPHPNDVDPNQLIALREFKKELGERGLYGEFGNPEELSVRVWQAVERDIVELDVAQTPVAPSRAKGVAISAQAGREALQEADNKGRLKTKTRHWVDVANYGTVDAEEMWVESAADRMHFGVEVKPRTLHAGQSQQYPFFLTFGDDNPSIVVHWTEGTEKKSKRFDI